MDILHYLVQKQLVKAEDAQAIEAQATKEGGSLEQALVAHGLSEDQILAAKSEYYGLPSKRISGTEISFDILRLIPENSIAQYKVLPLAVEGGVLMVGFVNPDDLHARDAVQFIASKNNMPFTAVIISEHDFNEVRQSYGGSLSGEVGEALTELSSEMSAEEQELSKHLQAAVGKDGKGSKEDEAIVEDAPVIKIVTTILKYATEGNASDVHIEPLENKVRVRFRIDGTLHTSLVLPIAVLSSVVARIKILSGMKLDEKRKPQDGRFSARVDNRKIDFRVSTFPTYYGEKVVMRILDSDRGVVELDKIGLTPRNLKIIKDAIDRPYGMILISGPTGSGKTTTLYSMLNTVDRETQNVLSLEDPVEYNVPGMNQSQVRPEIGYTFATGLRTTLRQDPDIIMVGEIRDKETAGLAVQAALTGHLVFSTIHTNDAVGVIPRLIDMGVDPYLIAPTLICAIAQRLVKKLCPDAGEPLRVDGSVRMMIDHQFADLPEEFRREIQIPEFVYSAAPSPTCANGTSGRLAVFEVMEMDRDIENVILKSANETEIYEKARAKGMMSLREDALLKSFQKLVPFEEVNNL